MTATDDGCTSVDEFLSTPTPNHTMSQTRKHRAATEIVAIVPISVKLMTGRYGDGIEDARASWRQNPAAW